MTAAVIKLQATVVSKISDLVKANKKICSKADTLQNT